MVVDVDDAGGPGPEGVVGPVVAVVPGDLVVVVVVVSSPRRYFPSSVPPQPEVPNSTAAVTAVTGIIVRSANPCPPTCSVRKRASLPGGRGGAAARG